MGYALRATVELITHTCNGCGMSFAAPNFLLRQFDEEGAFMRCPNVNCPWPSFSRQTTENQRLQKQIEEANRSQRYWKNEHELEKRSHSATKGKLTKTKNRLANGVCPCCNRSFTNLKRHMESKHPEYSENREKK